MSSMLSSWGWRAEASARNKIKMEWLPSIWNWSEVEISIFFLSRFQESHTTLSRFSWSRRRLDRRQLKVLQQILFQDLYYRASEKRGSF